MSDCEVEAVLVVVDIVDFVDNRWRVVDDVRRRVAETGHQGASILHFVDRSHRHIERSICQ